VTRLELRRRLDDRLRETSADLWPAVGERKQVVDRVSQGYRADARKHRWLVHEQADLFAGEPVYVSRPSPRILVPSTVRLPGYGRPWPLAHGDRGSHWRECRGKQSMPSYFARVRHPAV